MSEPWVPDEPPTLLPGRAAIEWGRTMWFSMVFAIAAIAAIGYAFFLAPEAWRQPLAGTALLAVLAAGTAGIYSSIQGVRRAGRERDRGYTTTYGDHRQLWQLDPGTGEVLRRPGEPKVRRGPR